jgi:hypothetical protein
VLMFGFLKPAVPLEMPTHELLRTGLAPPRSAAVGIFPRGFADLAGAKERWHLDRAAGPKEHNLSARTVGQIVAVGHCSTPI